MNVLLKKREVAFYLGDPEAKLLFAWHDFAEAAEAGGEETGAEVILVKPGEFEQLLGRPGAGPRHGRSRRRRHRSDPLHVRHDREAEGRRADAREPAPELEGRLGEARRDERGRRAPRRASAVPLVRPDLHDEQRGQRGRDRDDAARASTPTRRSRSSSATRSRSSRASRRCTTRCSTRRRATARLLVAPDLHVAAAPRCRRADARASRRSSAASSSRATGCRRPRPSPPSTTRTGSASPARSARPIEGVEMQVWDDDGNEVAAGRGRRDRDPRPQHHEGLLEPPGRQQGGDHRGRLVPHGRHGQDGRGRLLLHRRPQEGPDHPRRLQRLPA